jgi:hypothetical protein
LPSIVRLPNSASLREHFNNLKSSIELGSGVLRIGSAMEKCTKLQIRQTSIDSGSPSVRLAVRICPKAQQIADDI